jgi:DNA-binding MarR family transcriptional regulator
VRIARHRLTVQGTQVQPGMTGVLAAIDRGGAGDVCHPKELAVQCGLTASTISRAVAALVTRGLVQRATDPVDGRAAILTLTPAGRHALAELEQRQAEMLACALGEWTTSEIDDFAATLARFVHDMTSYLDGASAAPAAGANTSGIPEQQTSTLEAAL